MTTYYVDPLLSTDCTSGDYSIANRDCSGSDGNAYQIFFDAYTAASNDDTIEFRGLGTTHTAFAVLIGKRLTIRTLPADLATQPGVYAKVQGNGSNHLFRFSAGGTDSVLDGFNIIGGGSVAKYGINPEGATTITAKNIRDSGWTGAECIRSIAGMTLNLHNFMCSGQSPAELLCNGGTFNLYSSKLFSSGTDTRAIRGSSGQMNIYNTTIMGCAVAIESSNADIDCYNVLIGGVGLESLSSYTLLENGTGSITVHSGVVNGNTHRGPNLYTSGNVTLAADVVQNGYIELDNGINDASVCFVAIDSSHITAATIDDYQAACNEQGVHMTLYTDDQNDYSAANITRARSFVAAGHEFACGGQASTAFDDFDCMTVQYTGAAGACDLIISDSGNQIEIVTTGGVDDLGPWDTSKASGETQSLINTGAGGLKASIEDNVNYAVVLLNNPQPDDGFSYTLEDGTYDLSGGGAVTIPYNQARFLNEEVTVSKSDAEDVSATPIKTFHYNGFTHSAAAQAQVEADGFIGAVGRSGVGNAMYDPTKFNLILSTHEAVYDSYVRGTDWGTLNAAQQQERIRQWVRCIATTARYYGWYVMVELHASTSTPQSQDEVEWLISEFKTCNVNVRTVEELVEYINDNAIEGSTTQAKVYAKENPAQGAASIGIGTGVNHRGTAPHFVGFDGNPFPDYDIDAGAVQSTNSPFDPANL